MRKTILLVFLALVLGAIVACSPKDITLTIQFDATEGLKVADSVIFAKNRIGSVSGITYTAAGDYLVAIKVQKGFRNALTVDSAFYIDRDPVDTARMALIIEQAVAGGSLLVDGALVKGAPRPSSWQQMFDTWRGKAGDWQGDLNRALEDLKKGASDKSAQVDRQLQDAIEDASRRLSEMQKAIKEASDSQEVKELQKAVQNLIIEIQEQLSKLEQGSQSHDGGLPDAQP